MNKDFKHHLATALAVPDDQLDDELITMNIDTNSAADKVNAELVQIFNDLRLPLAECLGVPDEQVAGVSRSLLEKMVRLRTQRTEILTSLDKRIEDALAQVPADMRAEAQSYVHVLFGGDIEI
jgi:hypothetical protein